MASDTNMIRRGSIWGLRIAIPQELRALRAQIDPQRRQREIWRTTGTSDQVEARTILARLKLEALESFQAEAAQLRAQLDREARPRIIPTHHQLEAIAFGFKAEERMSLFFERLNLPSQTQLDADLERAIENAAGACSWDVILAEGADPRGMMLERRAHLVAALRGSLVTGDNHLVDWRIQVAAQDHGFDLAPSSPANRFLAHLLIKAWVLELESAEASFLDIGLQPLTPPDMSATVVNLPSLRPPALLAPSQLLAKDAVSTLFKRYLEERHLGEISATRLQREAVLRILVEVCGDKAPHLYTREDVSEFKAVVRRLPANAFRTYPGRTASEIVAGLPLGTKGAATKTVNDKLNKLAVFGRWLSQNATGVEETTFTTSMFKAARKEKLIVLPFTNEQVLSIFHSTPFVGCQSEKMQSVPGTYQIRDWRFWVPLIAAFSGARLNEITQLKPSDIVNREGMWVIQISEDGEGQVVKTKQSARSVPVHSKLIGAGFLALVDAAVAAGQEDLFATIPKDSDGRRSTRASTYFRKLLARLGTKQLGERGGIHRFRHAVIDCLRAAGMANHEFAPLLGHDTGLAAMTAGYGKEQQMTLQQRREAVERINYPGLHVELLKTSLDPPSF